MNIVRTKTIKIGQEILYNYLNFPYPPFYSPKIYLAKPVNNKGSVNVMDKIITESQFIKEGGDIEYQKGFTFNNPEIYFIIQDYQDEFGNSNNLEIDKIIVEK